MQHHSRHQMIQKGPWHKPAGRPKRFRSAYNFYFRDERRRLLARSGHDSSKGVPQKELSRAIATHWKIAKPSVKSYYQELAAKDKRRYALDLVRWHAQEEEERRDEENKEAIPKTGRTGSPVKPTQKGHLDCGTRSVPANFDSNANSEVFIQRDTRQNVPSEKREVLSLPDHDSSSMPESLSASEDSIPGESTAGTGSIRDNLSEVEPLNSATDRFEQLFDHDDIDFLRDTFGYSQF